MNAARLYFGNLQFNVDAAELEDWMLDLGYDVVEVSIPSDRNYRYKDRFKNKGFAFVELCDVEEAKLAMRELNGETGPRDRILQVKSADPKKPRR